ncbi:FlaG family protein [Helicobacter winghamensis]|uniref:Flagellar biosynthesis protein FlaG n=1 Tax=Helicobacter winghamensis TaxID=157268 RepID=A0A2N3PKG8_9HELI|nr:FlaG family protein [Helicobacter winghamensis]PKT76975.1 flagellar biosynthesis protein FlaG [Helicobacter winghamensis]PKT77115.1 flagellar biosynthesis protein FlaG [Helicobacter winghamensis]PKT77676.1 flagellar biosynthesis protein FlaG [Helicobacter winghamensis]PKT81914.1 flagellar biosynthesis protein FlaG [Helicobacter winghamensis]PKT82093.1 flagellar biosynthesis protein FlaG [Helicobacter winghamensis]
MNVNELGMNLANTQNSAMYSKQNQMQAPTKTQAMQKEMESLNEEQKIQEQKEKLNELAQQLNRELNPLNTNVTFGFSEDIEGLYVTVSERDTNRIIRKIPSDEAMELMAKMKEVVGIIFNKQA